MGDKTKGFSSELKAKIKVASNAGATGTLDSDLVNYLVGAAGGDNVARVETVHAQFQAFVDWKAANPDAKATREVPIDPAWHQDGDVLLQDVQFAPLEASEWVYVDGPHGEVVVTATRFVDIRTGSVYFEIMIMRDRRTGMLRGFRMTRVNPDGSYDVEIVTIGYLGPYGRTPVSYRTFQYFNPDGTPNGPRFDFLPDQYRTWYPPIAPPQEQRSAFPEPIGFPSPTDTSFQASAPQPSAPEAPLPRLGGTSNTTKDRYADKIVQRNTNSSPEPQKPKPTGEPEPDKPPKEPTAEKPPAPPKEKDLDRLTPREDEMGGSWLLGIDCNPLTGLCTPGLLVKVINQYNPGRGKDDVPTNGPRLQIGDLDLVVNPDPNALRGAFDPRNLKVTPGIRIGPGGRPDPRVK